MQVKSVEQFESDGCDNCESVQVLIERYSAMIFVLNNILQVLHLRDRKDNILECTR